MSDFEPEAQFEGERTAEVIEAELEAFARMNPALGALAARGPDGEYVPDYAGAAVNVWTQTLTLWWRGDFPAAVRGRIAQAAPWVRIDVRRSPYGRGDLLAALSRAGDDGYLYELGIEYAFVREDGQGVVLVAHGRERRLPSERRLSQALGVPTVPVILDAPPPANDVAASRRDDPSPRKGNASIRISGGGSCTTGYAIQRFVNGAYQRRMIGASHCDPGYGFDQSSQSSLNRSDGSNAHHTPAGQSLAMRENDIRVMNSTGAATSGTMIGWIYTGAWDGNSNSAKKVDQRGFPEVYWQPVMVGGRTTGDRFGRVINADGLTICGDTGGVGTLCPVVAAGNPDLKTISAPGDSGATVYSTGPAGGVIVHGHHIQRAAGDENAVPCDGPRISTAHSCGKISLYVSNATTLTQVNERTTGINSPKWTVVTEQ